MVCCVDICGRWLALLAACALHATCQADASDRIYLIEDDTVAIHLSDRAGDRHARLLSGTAATQAPPGAAARLAHERPAARRAAVDNIVQQAAVDHALDPELLHAVIAVESGYSTRAVSRRGALGLMQLMPATAREYGVTDPFDADQNIRAGALHLRRLLDQFNHDMRLALAAYNAGAGAVQRYGHSVPPFAETMAYVPRVLRLAGAQSAHR